jgi:threonine/homoserine/homoserine lactone efflux protein
MSFIGFIPLVLFVAVSTITPGGATTLATASGAHFGYRRSISLIAGIALGLALMAASASMGLAGILLAFPSLQLAMKLMGSLYLLWLAWKTARSGPPHLQTNIGQPIHLIGAIFLVLHNPKGWAMTLSASASFSAIEESPLYLALILGGTFGIAAIMSLSLWCFTGLILARIIKTDTQWHILNALLGVLLVISIIPMWF